jgi:ferredoxin-NADP reductase/Na+-translocating ferredoxin:NAD+ oxidoreductase RnfD subunit
MYRLVLYGLTALAACAFLLSLFGAVHYPPLNLFFSLLILVAVAWGLNELLARLFKAPVNVESAYITAFILFFLLTPPGNFFEAFLTAGAGALAVASKYFFVYKKKHFLNPAAAGAFLLGLFGFGLSVWWVATPILSVLTAIVGFLVARKIRRLPLYFTFILFALLSVALFAYSNGANPWQTALESLLSWPVFFLAGFMLTEPLTTPPTRSLQIIYGLLVGLLFALPFEAGPVFSSPELALLLGNVFSFFVSMKGRLALILTGKRTEGIDIYDFAFSADRKLAFQPGQYLEWTLPHASPDSRGNRRYFTIASSPTEKDLHLGARVMEKSSSFKRALLALREGEKIFAGELRGDFTLPEDKNRKLAWIGGGVGITPFRSMAKYLTDTAEKMDVVLFYACVKRESFAYGGIFDDAQRVGIKTRYIITDSHNLPENWDGLAGPLSPGMLTDALPDWKERLFYLSGPQGMVDAYRDMLRGMGVHRKNIRTDYFPGF